MLWSANQYTWGFRTGWCWGFATGLVVGGIVTIILR